MANPVRLGTYAEKMRVLEAQMEELGQRLHGGGGGSIAGPDSMDAKIAAAEARTDTKFAQLRGDLARFATKGTVWGAVGTALGIVLAVLAFAANRFDAGVSAGGTLAPYVEQQRQRDAAQDRKLDEILRRLPPAPR